MTPVGEKTVDGFELQFGTNVLGHHIFTMGLIDIMKSTAVHDGQARIICTGSDNELSAGKKELQFDDLEAGKGKNAREVDTT